MAIDELLKTKREDILRIAAKHGARNVRVFGSVARGEADEESDIDFLVEMEPGRSLLDMGGLLMELRDLLEQDVDVITERGLKPHIGVFIESAKFLAVGVEESNQRANCNNFSPSVLSFP